MNKTIIISGAGSGIGAATARAFLDDGYHVGLIGRRAKTLEATADGHKNALVLQCDVADPGAVDKAFALAMTAWGRLDRYRHEPAGCPAWILVCDVSACEQYGTGRSVRVKLCCWAWDGWGHGSTRVDLGQPDSS